MMKQSESPYLISATPMPSMSLLGLCSSFSCFGKRVEKVYASKLSGNAGHRIYIYITELFLTGSDVPLIKKFQ